MSLGSMLQKALKAEEEQKLRNSLTGINRDLAVFLEKTWEDIVSDIESGYPVSKIAFPAYLGFYKHFHKNKEADYKRLFLNFREKARSENLEIDIEEIAANDFFSREGGIDYWLTVKPYFPPAPNKD